MAAARNDRVATTIGATAAMGNAAPRGIDRA